MARVTQRTLDPVSRIDSRMACALFVVFASFCWSCFVEARSMPDKDSPNAFGGSKPDQLTAGSSGKPVEKYVAVFPEIEAEENRIRTKYGNTPEGLKLLAKLYKECRSNGKCPGVANVIDDTKNGHLVIIYWGGAKMRYSVRY